MLLTKWHSIYQITAYERGGTCGTHWQSREMYKESYWGNLKERNCGKSLNRFDDNMKVYLKEL